MKNYSETDGITADLPVSGNGLQSEKVAGEKHNTKKRDMFERIIYYAAAPIIALVFFTVYLIYLNIYPFGKSMMASYDMLAQIAPFAEHYFDVFEGKGSLFYSFAIAGGADVFGTLAYCMISPFSFIFLLGGRGMVAYMVPFVLGAKIAVIALSATFAIKKLFPSITPVSVSVIAVLYTYSGYFSVANTYINWLDFLIYMPVVIYTFRKFMQTGKYLLFSVSVAAMIYACFSIACFSLLIIFLILFAYVYFCVEKQNRKETITKICMSLVLSVAFALPLIIPALSAYLKSGRNTGLFSNLNNNLSADHLYSKLSYVFSDAIFFICGLYYFIICDKKSQMNKFLMVAAALIFAPVLIDEICLLLNAGSYMSYSLRFGFLNSALGLYLTCKLVENVKEEKADKKYKWPLSCVIGTVTVILCVLVVYAMQDVADNGKNAFLFTTPLFKEGTLLYKMFEQSDFAASFSSKFAHSIGGLELISFIFGAIALSAVIVFILTRYKIMPVKVSACLLIIFSLLQAGFMSYHTVAGNRNSMITYEQIQVCLDDIAEREENFESFRIKDYNNKVTADAPFTLHYRAFTVFSSVIDSTNFVPTSYFNYTGNGINTMKSQGGNVFSDCLFGYKYAYSSGSAITAANWEKIGDHSPFYLFENKYVFPTAFKIPGGEYSITDGNYGDQLDGLYNFLGGEGKLTVRSNPTDIKYYDDDGYFRISFHPTERCAGNSYLTALLPENLNVKYCNSSIYTEEDAKEINKDFRLSCGYTSSRPYSVITIKSDDKSLTEEIIKDSFQLVTISLDKVKELSVIANENAVDADFGRNTISGKVTANEGECIFVNYMAIKGYKCEINGEKQDLVENGLNFLVAELNEGENEITFKYTSPYIKYILIGIILGGIFAAAMILAFRYYTKIKKAFELVADYAADFLAVFIFGFGFCYPLLLFLWKCVKAIIGLF